VHATYLISSLLVDSLNVVSKSIMSTIIATPARLLLPAAATATAKLSPHIPRIDPALSS